MVLNSGATKYLGSTKRSKITVSLESIVTNLNRDKNHTDFIQAYYKIFNALVSYLKEHFPGGLTWNNKDGIDAVEALKQIQSGTATPKASAAATNGAPPPPPTPHRKHKWLRKISVSSERHEEWRHDSRVQSTEHGILRYFRPKES